MKTQDDLIDRLKTVLYWVGSVLAMGVLGYRFIEGWSYLDSLYMTVITLATVGYGETHPLDARGRLFTMFLILMGISVMAYGISMITAFIVEGELKDVLKRRRMEAKIGKLSGHYIICGAGHTGKTIVEELSKTKREFVVVEKDPAKVAALQDRGFLALQGDPTDDETLLNAGIRKARGLFGALGSDPDNVFVTISAKGLNPDLRVVCKQQEKGVHDKLKRSGADVVVDPGFIGGLRMASEMIRPAAVGFLDSMLRAEGKVFRVEEVTIPKGSPLTGRPLETVKGADGDAALVVAVRLPREKTYDFNPRSSRALEPGEVLVAMGTIEQVKALEEKVKG